MVTPKSQLIKIEADPVSGFNYPYLLYIPARTPLGDTLSLLVEPNNTGLVNDTLAIHERAARHLASVSSVGNHVAKRLAIPLLVPIFPRPATNWQTYTHALDRDAALIRQGDMARLDLQLLAMIDHARTQLTKHSILTRRRVLLNGFSASGTFVNRLTVLHPERVAAVASGGTNALTILPVLSLNGTTLPYPLGLNDVDVLFGKSADLPTYRQVPQLVYIGEHDTNDAVLYDDGYSDDERNRVYAVIGRAMFPDRWRTCETVYKANGLNATFRIYPGIGHGTDNRINDDVAEFFKRVMADHSYR